MQERRVSAACPRKRSAVRRTTAREDGAEHSQRGAGVVAQPNEQM